MVKGISHINHPNHLCEACLLGKHARKSFPKEAESKAKVPFQLVPTNVCGPIDPLSFDKNIFCSLLITLVGRKVTLVVGSKNPRLL